MDLSEGDKSVHISANWKLNCFTIQGAYKARFAIHFLDFNDTLCVFLNITVKYDPFNAQIWELDQDFITHI